MSLLRLLAAGKSLVGMSDAETRYRVTSQRLLPQFGAGRNPFSSRGKAGPAQLGPSSPEDHGPTSAPQETRRSPALRGEPEAAPRRGPQGVATPASCSPKRFGEGLRRRTAALLAGWKMKMMGVLAKRRRKATNPAIPRFTEPPVQGELSLDRIKVVRNDLSDADLEVIPARPPTAPVTRANAGAARTESAWGRVTARVLGAGRT
jgi:hypothetical protein